MEKIAYIVDQQKVSDNSAIILVSLACSPPYSEGLHRECFPARIEVVFIHFGATLSALNQENIEVWS